MAENEALSMEMKLQESSVDERIKLVEDLWDSIAADQGTLPITAAQRTELDLRLNAYSVDRIVDDRRPIPFVTFAAACDRRCPAASGSRAGSG
jgi:putative addiction module component (TIGR02574 family)